LMPYYFAISFMPTLIFTFSPFRFRLLSCRYAFRRQTPDISRLR
jgi:hypothetical protein